MPFSIADVVAKQSFVTRFGLNNLITLGNIQPLVQMTAKEFMMGYKSNLMTLGNTFMPGWIYFDKLGLIDRMYDFNGDYETIFTGEDDVRNSGLIDTYRGSKDLPQWHGSHCSNVQGASDGTKFRGGVTRNESLLFFRKSLCRAAPLVSVKEGVKSGLKAYMYTFPEHLFDNGKHTPENKCFCRNDRCLPEGLIDVTDCYYGFPIALSYPHFYKGDDELFNKIEGLSPNKELHETRFWIQPESGLPLDVSAKFQINMALGDISRITNAGKFANLYLPMLWFDIRMYSLPKSLEDRFNMYLNILPIVEKGALYLFFPIGAALILLSVYRLAFKVMFKTFDGKKKQRNCIIASKQMKDVKKVQKDIYAPCEIALNDTESDNSDPQFDEERRPSFFKTHSDRLRELSHRLGDRVYDSVGSVKDKVHDVLHVQKVFNDRKNSLITKDDSVANDGFKSDSGDERTGSYEAVRQSDSEDDCRYLEVVDDGSGFDGPTKNYESRRGSTLKGLDDTVIVEFSD
ncbi:scavenger receptor class B member 1-like [Choristoneura fumiferana]|uniref:scavenger receptor class B member 1-like n=1 Tax=Choristoneura fumiferana TaxID=7141 RepID=UPI003D15DCF4